MLEESQQAPAGLEKSELPVRVRPEMHPPDSDDSSIQRMTGQYFVADKDKSLAKKLTACFTLAIALLMGVCYFALDRSERANACLQWRVADSLASLDVAQRMASNSTENGGLVLYVFLSRQPLIIDGLLARLAENNRRTDALLADLQPHCRLPAEKQLCEEIKSARAAYMNSYQRAHTLLLKDNKPDEAGALILQETTPLFFHYEGLIGEFWQFQMDEIRAFTEEGRQQDVATRRIVLAAIFFAGLLCAGVALFAVRTVSLTVGSRRRMQDQVNALNQQLEQRVMQRTQKLQETEEQLRRSLNQLQEYTNQVETVNEFVELLQSCLTLEEAYHQATRVLEHFFPAGSLLMLNSSRNLLDVAGRWGEGASSGKVGPFSPESCWGLRKGRAHLVKPGTSGLICTHLEPDLPGCHICVPMVAQGESLGVLSVADPGPEYGDVAAAQRQQDLATRLGEQISLAFANLQLRETLKYQSVRDSLTGMFNRRHMEEVLMRELQRAARNGKPIAVVMADIDHFKQFNDSFGHAAGDVLLRDLGAIFRNNVRGGDMACRYGGEEFLLILVDTDAEVAGERALQLCEQVRKMNVRHHGEVLRQVTLSVGIAVFPRHGTTTAQLIGAADESLYKAKAAGRDRVVLCGATVPLPPADPNRETYVEVGLS